jgi:hypothetical protein
MRRFGICSVFTVLGFVIAFGLYMTLGMLLLNFLQHKGGGSAEDYLGVAFMAVLPVCLTIGSFVPGYFAQPYIRSPYFLILLCPGLYVAITVIGTSGGTIGGFLEFMLLCSAVWILSSMIGVYLGKYLRAKRTKALPVSVDGAPGR